ncbi:MAG: response regulator [Mediterranea sp.]|jgi:signal transduction histidine kinase/ligand-binding sensor domain-containing protein/DNA-binding response OmpR family regulator|nr:response regulator [Mediterranea sp.]
MKRFRFLTFVALGLLLGTRPVVATVEVRSIQRTTNDGIANNSVYCIFQDSRGFIWMGTLNGLSRYDGNTFVNYQPSRGTTDEAQALPADGRLSVTTNHIRRIDEDRNGLLWIESSGEFYNCYDPRRDCFVDFTGNGEYRQHYDRWMEASDGTVWLWSDGRRSGCRRVTYADGQFTSTVYRQSLGTLMSDSVRYVYEDPRGGVWIGSARGVSRVDGDRTVIVARQHQSHSVQAYGDAMFFLSSDGQIARKRTKDRSATVVTRLAGDAPTSVYCSFSVGEEWVIFTSRGGLVFNFRTGEVNRRPEWDLTGAPGMLTDNRGDYWIYNHTGRVWHVNRETGHVRVLALYDPNRLNYVDEERYHIVHDSRGIIWISTYGNGLFAYDSHTDELQRFEYRTDGLSHISSNFLQYVMEDNRGGIWVSAEYAGLSCLTVLNEGVRRIFPESMTLSDRSNTVRSIVRMDNGEIYASTRGGGLYVYDSTAGRLLQKTYYKRNVYGILEDADGKLWLGSRGGGLRVDGKPYAYRADDATSLSNNNIFALYRDSRDRVWVGTFGGGLNLATRQSDGSYTFRSFLNGNYGQRQIRSILEDRNGRMWVGTSDGVCLFHPDTLIANSTRYWVYSYDNGALGGSAVKCVYEDDEGRVWIATSGGGVSMAAPGEACENVCFVRYDTRDGLVNNMVQAIAADSDGYLWISTEYGISRFCPRTRRFNNYFFSLYTLGDTYSDNSVCVLPCGKLLFGTNYGMVVVDPSAMKPTAAADAAVTFTNLRVNGIDVRPGETDSPLTEALTYTDRLTLTHAQNSFQVDFTGFDYGQGGNDTYTYRLEPYDKEWSAPAHTAFAAYKNLPSGEYRLRVRRAGVAGGEEGDRTAEAVLAIVVTPPLWRSTGAIALYIVLLFVGSLVAYRLIYNFNHLRNRVQVEKRLTEYKLVFFTNISHEFRTPLTLIQGAMEKMTAMIDTSSSELGEPMSVMNKGVRRMLRLINQLLEFRKMQNNRLALRLEKSDVIGFLYEIVLSFREVAKSKAIDFRFSPAEQRYIMYFDKSNLDKVVYNLLSNAFKYTPRGGEVTLTATAGNGQFVIAVADTGPGIAKEKRGELFKRFMQTSFSDNSTGIGLHLTHELVEVHRGTIGYDERAGGGSVFTVTLPVDSSVYAEGDFPVPHTAPTSVEETPRDEEETPENAKETEETGEERKRHRLLLIEDDDDVRQFLAGELRPYYDVVTEPDGEAGLARARVYDADLIVCDVLMPGLTGFELTRRLKDDFATSHIPIILMTAMNNPESHQQGMESGADAYITKPFGPKLLLTYVRNIIARRERLRQKFSGDPSLALPEMSQSEQDKRFLVNLQSLLEQQMGNCELSPAEVAEQMNIGRSAFFVKVRGVTGYSPGEYLRIVRMKKAAELLRESDYNVSEVAYKVGFDDPFYFSKCFKKQFGHSPSKHHDLYTSRSS